MSYINILKTILDVTKSGVSYLGKIREEAVHELCTKYHGLWVNEFDSIFVKQNYKRDCADSYVNYLDSTFSLSLYSNLLTVHGSIRDINDNHLLFMGKRNWCSELKAYILHKVFYCHMVSEIKVHIFYKVNHQLVCYETGVLKLKYSIEEQTEVIEWESKADVKLFLQKISFSKVYNTPDRIFRFIC